MALLAYGNMVAPAFEAAKTLQAEGISVEFINLRWAKPLDKNIILDTARRTGKLIVMEEGVVDRRRRVRRTGTAGRERRLAMSR